MKLTDDPDITVVFKTGGHVYAYTVPRSKLLTLVESATTGDPKVVVLFANIITRGNHEHAMCCCHQIEHAFEGPSQ